MDTHKPVLVGYDGSTGAGRALEAAAQLADQLGTSLHLLVAQSPYAGEATSSPELVEALEEALDAAADRVRGTHPDLEVTTAIEWQPPRTALVEAGRNAVVTVVGRRGHGPVKALFLGSVSGSVASHAKSPVLVVPDQEVRADGDVVVGVDGSPESLRAAEWAATLAGNDRVVLLHAWLPAAETMGALGPTGSYVVIDAESERREHHDLLNNAVDRIQAKHPDVQVVGEVVSGNPTHALGEASASARLVVVGGHGKGGFVDLLIGSTARSVLYTSEAPVLVVRGD